VIDQGTLLDRIDYNMEQVVEHMEKGVEQLESAEELQKSARPRTCITVSEHCSRRGMAQDRDIFLCFTILYL
jgi:hypothetical protein